MEADRQADYNWFVGTVNNKENLPAEDKKMLLLMAKSALLDVSDENGELIPERVVELTEIFNELRRIAEARRRDDKGYDWYPHEEMETLKRNSND